MTSDDSFKQHPLGTHERLWLQEAARPGFFPRRGLENLRGKIPDDFRPGQIDSRLYAGNRIMPIGLWHVDPQHPELGVLDEIIRTIKARIPTDDVAITITAADIAAATGIDEKSIARGFERLIDFGGGFFNQVSGPASGEGFHSVHFSKGNLFDYYRKYQGIEDLLERAYTRPGKDFFAPEPPATPARVTDAPVVMESRPEPAKATIAEKPHTLYDSAIEKLKNNKIAVALMLLATVVVGIGKSVESVQKIFHIGHSAESSTSAAVIGERATLPTPAQPASEDFRIVKAIPGWDAQNIYWPKIPQEEDSFRAIQQNVMNQCGLCMAMTDHSAPGEDGVQNRPGSYIEFDARKCETGIRLALRATKLRHAAGTPAAVSWVFDSIDVVPGMTTRIDVAEVNTASAAPVQCLK